MYEFFSIGEIADFFQIPKSKLRYWDKEGLIKLSRNTSNDYREYSVKAVTDVANIMFYRSLNIPIKELKTLSDKKLDDLAEILNKSETRVNAQIQELENTKKRIESTKAALAKIYTYQQNPYVKSEFDFNNIVEFKRGSHKHLQRCIENSANFAVLAPADPNAPIIGGVIYEQPDADDTVIWRNTQKQCLKCIVKYQYGPPQRTITAGIAKLRAYLDEHNYTYGNIITRFLISEFGDTPLNYHEAYIELE